jgi:hypothetical protein
MGEGSVGTARRASPPPKHFTRGYRVIVTDTPADVVAFPARSVATAVRVCVARVALRVFQTVS